MYYGAEATMAMCYAPRWTRRERVLLYNSKWRSHSLESTPLENMGCSNGKWFIFAYNPRLWMFYRLREMFPSMSLRWMRHSMVLVMAVSLLYAHVERPDHQRPRKVQLLRVTIWWLFSWNLLFLLSEAFPENDLVPIPSHLVNMRLHPTFSTRLPSVCAWSSRLQSTSNLSWILRNLPVLTNISNPRATVPLLLFLHQVLSFTPVSGIFLSLKG